MKKREIDKIADKFGNEVPAKCPKCGGAIIPSPDVTGAIGGGQCRQCYHQVNTIACDAIMVARANN